MKKIYLSLLAGLLFILATNKANAQLTGTKNIPGDYATLALAITDLNTQGVGAGGVTFNIVAGNAQTAIAGGYVIGGAGSAIIIGGAAPTSAANPVIIQGNGNTITAFGGQTAGLVTDAIFKLIGADYITLQNMTMQENAANTTTAVATNNMTEWGVALLYVTTTDGCQNNTIQNNTISLNRAYNNTFGIYSNTCHAAATPGTLANITAATGQNSPNKVYGNQVSNVNFGIIFIGSNTAALMDNANDIGGVAAPTGNTITNWGGLAATAATYTNLTGNNGCIGMWHQVGYNVSYNSITSGALTVTTLTHFGIINNYPVTAPTGTFTNTISFNTITITVNAAGSTGAITAINNTSTVATFVAGATVNINNNTVTAQLTAGTTGQTQSISNSFIAGTVNINNNLVANSINNGTAAGAGIFNIINSIACTNLTINANTVRGNAASTAVPFCQLIQNSGAVTGTINITNNNIGDATAGAATYAVAAGVVNMFGIINSGGTATTALNITGNTLRGFSYVSCGGFNPINTQTVGCNPVNISNNNLGVAVAGGGLVSFSGAQTSTLTGIGNGIGVAGGALNITGNSIRGINFASTGPAVTGISQTFDWTTGTININNNNLGTGDNNTTGSMVKYNVAQGFSFVGISNNAGTGSILSISGNNFQGVNYSVASTGGFTCIIASGTSGTETINNNNFNNLTVNTNSSSVGFLISATNSTPTVTISGNYITTQYTNSNATGGANYIAIANNGGATTTGSTTISNNILSNITYKTTTSFGAMVYWNSGTGAACSHNIIVSGNTINNVANTGVGTATQAANNYGLLVGLGNANVINNNSISNLTASGGTVIGIFGGTVSTNAAGSLTVRNNTLYNLSSSSAYSGSAAGGAVGIQIQSGPASNQVYKNKIYNINANQGTVSGIVIAQATATSVNNVYNNLMGQLYATNSVFYQAVRGINSGSTVGNTLNAYYNTVYLDGNCPGNSYAVYMASTNPTIRLNNNIFVNNATPTGGLEQLVIFTTGALNATYATTSNNNILYAGTPGALNLIYGNGAAGAITNPQQTLAAFQAFVGPTRENVSKTENPPFINTTIPANTSYLHINPTIATQAESGAVNIATYTDDYDADIRQGNPGYPGTSTGTAPDIGADEFDVTIDNFGPEINYTLLTSSVCTLSKTFTATITDYSGVNITAGTLPRVYYKKSTNTNGLGGTNTNTTNGWKYAEAVFLGGSSFSFTIDNTLVFGGVAAGDNIQYFVTAQDLFSPANVGINSGTFAATPASVALTGTAFPLGGTINSYNIVLPLPTAITIGVAGTYTSLSGAGGLFADLNAKGISGNTIATILDAAITETGATSLNAIAYGCSPPYTLTIKPATGVTSTLSGTNATALINLNGANYVTIDGSNNGTNSRDLTISNTNTTGPTVLLQNGASNNSIKNCIVQGASAGFGVITLGSTTSTGNNNNLIQNNNITKSASAPIVGIYNIGLPGIPNASNVITNNIITDFSYVGFADGNGGIAGYSNNTQFISNEIYQTGTATGDLTGIMLNNLLGITGMSLSKNYIHDLTTSSTGTIVGIDLYDAASVTVANNMIALSNSTANIRGIAQELTAGATVNIYYNSVSVYGSTGNTNTSFSFLKNFTSIGDIVKDNIFYNNRTSGGGATNQYGIYSTTVGTFTSDYNDIYSFGTARNIFGNAAGIDQATLAAWQTATGQDANSLSVNPFFTSATDLHLVNTLNCQLDGYGIPIAGITTDYDNNTRDVAAPDMGADEFNAVYTTILAGVAGSAVCANKTVSPLGTTYGTSTCTLIAYLLPSGGSAVNGKVNVCVTLDATLQYFNGEPYVQRHHDLEPVISPTTATGTITLYYTDAEFVSYNTLNPVWPKLPTAVLGNADPNKANVRITQFHGTPTGGLPTTTPGNYTGIRVLIVPGAANVVWNGSYWAVTFPVTGFSGFYAHTTHTNAPLPISVNYLNGRKQGGNHLLDWKVTCVSTPRATMTLERSADARNFTGIYTITADAVRCNQPFDYTDTNPLNGMNYYRLKIVDADGKITYSTTVALLNASKGFDIIGIAPNPVVADNFKLNVTNAQASKMDISIFDMQGRLVNRQTIPVIAGFNSLDIGVANLASGTYTIQGTIAEERSKVIRFVKQ